MPLYDEIGSARGLVDANGAVTDTYDMDTFGTARSSTGSTPNPYRYGAAWGYMTDPSGFLQLGARYYWPEVGRFVSQDPIGAEANAYGYGANNPATYVDPSGELTARGIGGAIKKGWRTAAPYFRPIATGMAVAHTGAGGYLAWQCARCLSRATDMCRRAKQKLSAERYREWLKAAKPGTECIGVCLESGAQFGAAAGWWLGRAAAAGFPRAKPPWC